MGDDDVKRVLEFSPFAAHYYELRPDGTLVFTGANRSADQVLGVDNTRFIGKRIEEAFPHLVETAIPEAYRRVARTGVPFETEQIIYEDDDIRGAFDVRAIQMGPGSMAAFFTDITKRVKTEAALQRERDLVTRIMETSPVGIVTVDALGKFTFANSQAERVLGIGKEELLTRRYTIADWRMTDHKGGAISEKELPFTQVMETKRPVYDIRHTIEWAGGQRVFLSVNAAPLLDNNGEFRGMVATVEDVTTEIVSERENILLAQTLRSVKDCVSVTDLDDNIIFVNDAFIRTYGFTEEELLGNKISMVRSSSVSSRQAQEIFAATKKESWHGEVINKRKNGMEFPIEVWTSLVRNNDGTPIAMVGVARDITERKRADEALRESEERFSRLSEATFEGIGVTREGEIIDVNEQLTKMLGCTAAEMIGRNPLEFFAPESRPMAKEHIASPTGRPQEYIALRKDETRFPVEIRAKSLIFEGQRSIVAAIRDISERKEAEELLLKIANGVSADIGERFLRSIVGHLGGALKADYAYVAEFRPGEPETVRTLAMWIEGKIGGNIQYKLAGTPCENVLAGRQHTFAENVQLLFPTDGLLAEIGAQGYVGTPLFDSAGRTIGLMVVIWRRPLERAQQAELLMKIFASRASAELERKYSEEALKESESRYRDLIETARDAIFTLSLGGIFTSLNPAFESITGWECSEWLGKSFTGILHPDDLARGRKTLSALLQGRVGPPIELRALKKDGSYVVGEFTTTPQIKGGRVVGILGIVRDLSARKILEEQFRQAQKMESIGMLAGGVAHDFNNILSIILGHAALLKEKKDDRAMILKGAEAISTAASRGADLVRQLLTFARKTSIRLESIHLNDVLQETVRLLSETFSKKITIAVDVYPQLPPIEADGNQIHQVILNLSVNARDAMTKGGSLSFATSLVQGESLLRRFPTAVSREYVCLSCADTGTGMDEATLKRIFDPFFTTKEIGKGTGLGLSVVFAIVESHQGFIDVESKVGSGSVFRLYFPVEEKEIRLDEQCEVDYSSAPGGTETLLFVEDEESIRDLVCSLLREKGYTVLTAADGEEGFEIYSRKKDEISLVISDFGLPKSDGEELFHKAEQLNARLRFIMATGFIEPSKKDALLRAGVKSFIQKPYLLKDVLRQIRETIDVR